MAKFMTFFYGQMSGLEITCIQSFIDHGHDITIYSYDDCGAPGHFKMADAEPIIPKSNIFFYQRGPGKGSIAAFANVFRYFALSKLESTWWVDTDVICLSPQWPRAETIGAGWESDEFASNAVLYCSQKIANVLATRALSLGTEVQWGQGGPRLVTDFVREQNLNEAVLPQTAFYPISYEKWFMPFLTNCSAEARSLCAQSYSLHLWNEMGRRCKFDKNISPDPNSFVGSLIRKHNTYRYFRDRRRLLRFWGRG
jgi:hypothetical protein